jgi:CRP/FNR family cyclic AMP-dependent transcriptional regulator
MANKRTLGFSSTVFRKKFRAGITVRNYRDNEVVFSEGDIADAAFYSQSGRVRLTVASTRRKKAISVTIVINCEGTMTMLGGSILRPELEAVMTMAGRRFVSIPDLDVAAVEHAGMRTRRLQFVAKRSRSEK